MKNDLPEDWGILREWLPEQEVLNTSAREHGFMTRVKGLRDMSVWLRLLLMHAAGGLSLDQTVMRARELRLAKLSAVSLHQRLEKAAPWLASICERVIESNARLVNKRATGRMDNLIAVDATDIQRPGSTGADLRLHYAVNLASLRCEQLELTDKHGGERLGRFRFKKGQIVLGDRAYCRREGVGGVLAAGADVVVRFLPTSFPIEDKTGRRIDVLAWVRTLGDGEPGQRPVWFTHGGQRHAMRLCALRMGELAAGRALKRARRKAQKRSSAIKPQTEELSGYIMVLTSLEPAAYSTAQVLDVYRYRWQVELVFKRLKSLLHAGQLPKRNDACALAWVQAKILTALLVERGLIEARFFSPWGFRLEAGEPLDAVC